MSQTHGATEFSNEHEKKKQNTKVGTYRIDFNYSPESVLGETGNGGKKIPCGTWKVDVIGRRG
jgi:hypothetical protein